YVRFDDADDAAAYLTAYNGYLDTTAKNWAHSKLLALEAADIARVTYTLPDAPAFSVSRENADATWTSTDLPAGATLKTTAVTSLVSNLANLRFSDTTAPDHEDAK